MIPLNFPLMAYPGFSPALDFLIGFTGYLALKKIKWPGNHVYISFLQAGMLCIYFVCCYRFDKVWEPAPFILLALLLIQVCTLRGGIFDQLLGNSALVHLGNISFELYIVHAVVITLLSHPVIKIAGSHWAAALFLVLLLSVGIAEFFHWKKIRNICEKKIYHY